MGEVEKEDSDMKEAESVSNISASSKSDFVPESFSQKDPKAKSKEKVEEIDVKESDKEESESPEISI